MASVTFSSLLSQCSPLINHRHSLSKPPPTFSLHPPRKFPTSPLKCSLSSHLPTYSTQNSRAPSGDSLLLHLSASASQPPATAMRGADTDAIGLLLKERIVFLGNQVDDFVADAIISQLLLLDAQDPTKDIRLFVNSPGGSLSATMAIFDVVRLVRADVSTIALGISASTASLILGGGTKGKRFAMPNTRIMIHQPLGGASGQAIDVEIQAREVMHNKKNVTGIISDFTWSLI
ncbi:ATP-dependent Clp protease proteolytic subunit 4 [Abeliophyllum distichum]|uniref:ATP-dependent Clp protease proteolytic subunit n=1 Tax=Abeliophyllum distichum TaxID=126358 RepID=A0ABD1UJT4_9LAMI